MARSLLDRAAALAARGRYGELVVLLEPQLPIYRESERYYYLLGSACLHSGDNGGAYTYLKRAEQLDPRNADTLLCLAALHLRRGEGQRAIDYYLHVQELRPGDQLASRSLAFLKRPDADATIPKLLEDGGFERFYPRIRNYASLVRPLAIFAAVAVLALALWLLFPVLSGFLRAAAAARSTRPAIAAIALSDSERASPVQTGGSYEYIMTDKEAVSAFEKAKSLFQAYRDNAALVLLNRLLLSNAAPSIKEKAKTLKSFVNAPDFRTIRDVPTYKDVAAEPALYDGCSVLWAGAAANIVAAKGVTEFHFLVGYVNGQRLDGIVPVRLAAEKGLVSGNLPFELLATVRDNAGELRLDGVAIHTLR